MLVLGWVVPLPRMQSSLPGFFFIFRIGKSNLNLHLPLLTGRGDNPSLRDGHKILGSTRAEWQGKPGLPKYLKKNKMCETREHGTVE